MQDSLKEVQRVLAEANLQAPNFDLGELTARLPEGSGEAAEAAVRRAQEAIASVRQSEQSAAERASPPASCRPAMHRATFFFGKHLARFRAFRRVFNCKHETA